MSDQSFDSFSCEVCEKEAKLRCEGCLKSYYCSAECQAIHQQDFNHKFYCKTFQSTAVFTEPQTVFTVFQAAGLESLALREFAHLSEKDARLELGRRADNRARRYKALMHVLISDNAIAYVNWCRAQGLFENEIDFKNEMESVMESLCESLHSSLFENGP